MSIGYPQIASVPAEELEALRECEASLRRIHLGCLLDVRRAAFSPPLGARYTEAIRNDISQECARLENEAKRTLATLDNARVLAKKRARE
jgi:hypothetical protein